MIPNLGLVCITSTDEIRFRTVTRTRLLSLSKSERIKKLKELYSANIQKLEDAMNFCQSHGIRLYRLNSGVLPFSDHELGQPLLSQFSDGLKKVGKLAARFGIRLVLHPDQFVVLSSDSPSVVKNSIKMLEGQARLMDMLDQPRSPWAVIEIHGGKGGRSANLISVMKDLPEGIKNRIAFENDEYAYSADEILDICRATRTPMVFDAHHHVVHEKLGTYDHPSIARIATEAAKTWPKPEWQLAHISNGRSEFQDPHHSDYVLKMPKAYRKVPWIEVEAKLKEKAIDRLRQDWLKVKAA